MILKEEKIIFIHVPKTGGSSIEYALLASQGIELPLENVHRSIFENLTNEELDLFLVDKKQDKPQHMTAQWYKKHVPEYDSYYKFAVVRNPYNRFLSEYYWQKNLDGGAKLKAEKLQIDVLRNRERVHYKHQHKFLYDDSNNLLVDKVFKHEDYQAVVEMLNKRLNKQLPWYEIKRSYNKPDISDFLNDNPDVAHFIKYHYAEDFRRLEYKNES